VIDRAVVPLPSPSRTPQIRSRPLPSTSYPNHYRQITLQFGFRVKATSHIVKYNIPYILESNPHPFYSFRGPKNQMRIRIECGLYSRSRAGFCKSDRAGVRAVRTIQLFIILYIKIYIIYYSPDSPSSLITLITKKEKEKAVCLPVFLQLKLLYNPKWS
jgi:hypothetical protein